MTIHQRKWLLLPAGRVQGLPHMTQYGGEEHFLDLIEGQKIEEGTGGELKKNLYTQYRKRDRYRIFLCVCDSTVIFILTF